MGDRIIMPIKSDTRSSAIYIRNIKITRSIGRSLRKKSTMIQKGNFFNTYSTNNKRGLMYTGCPKTRNARFSLLWYSKIKHILISSDKALSSENNDTKIISLGSVVLILQPFLETQSITNFVKSTRAIYSGYSCPQVLSLFCLHVSMGFRATMYGSQKSHYPWLHCHENEEKTEEKTHHVLRNDHRIKTT